MAALPFEARRIWVATASIWAGTNPVLKKGSMAFESDTQKYKWGDGVTAFNSLPYASGEGMSQPPQGHYRVTNVYVNAETGKLEVEYEIPGG